MLSKCSPGRLAAGLRAMAFTPAGQRDPNMFAIVPVARPRVPQLLCVICGADAADVDWGAHQVTYHDDGTVATQVPVGAG